MKNNEKRYKIYSFMKGEEQKLVFCFPTDGVALSTSINRRFWEDQKINMMYSQGYTMRGLIFCSKTEFFNAKLENCCNEIIAQENVIKDLKGKPIRTSEKREMLKEENLRLQHLIEVLVKKYEFMVKRGINVTSDKGTEFYTHYSKLVGRKF